MRKYIVLILLLIGSYIIAYAESDNPRTIEYYFNLVNNLELMEMKRVGLITDKDSIAEQYSDKTTHSLNEKGFMKYAEIKADVYIKFFKDYLFLQSIYFKDDVYVLYFSVAGFDDVEFQIIKWHKKDWDKSEKLNMQIIGEPNQKFQQIASNYDEGPKNLENVKLFVKNDYLVLERSGLYHTLYDLKENQLLINEESPWHSANAENLETMNQWIKDNIHSKIEAIINQKR